jgi:hypothetical protein
MIGTDLLNREAQPADQKAPNTLFLGSGTAAYYDSNATSSRPAVQNTQYVVYPQIGISLLRSRWDAAASVVPGISFSSADLPQYKGLSIASTGQIRYHLSARTTLTLVNYLISNTNPFNSLTFSSTPNAPSSTIANVSALNYLPQTNERASASAEYNLSRRMWLVGLLSYNYLSYQHDGNIPDAAQPFQQSNSGQVTAGIHRRVSHKYEDGIELSSQIFAAGLGRIRTLGQSVAYTARYAPTEQIQIAGTIGPQYVSNSFSGSLFAGARTIEQRTSGWTWSGSADITWVIRESRLTIGASKELNLGTQYQGNVDETTLTAAFRHHFKQCDMAVFGGYTINQPVFYPHLATHLSNNYVSTGIVMGKTIAHTWNISAGYWYLLQNSPATLGPTYYGDHNRVAVSLSYSIAKPFRN